MDRHAAAEPALARLGRLARPLLLAGCALLLGGCSTLGYYRQAVAGGLEILTHRRPIAKLLRDERTPDDLAARLARVLEIRDFASADLSLPDNGSYRSYVDLDRPYASWTVTAAGELSVEPVEWCFLFAGCVTYRGYFSPRRAERYAERLQRDGYDVSLGGVTAFSTLGWFEDPVLSTFVELPEHELAGLLFHELAHQRVYVKDGTEFNESFATVVEVEGVRRWLEANGRGAELAEYRATRVRREAIEELVSRHRERLAEAYGQERSKEWKRQRKAAILGELAAAYRRLSESGGGDPGYDAWFAAGLNNARLASIGVYHGLEPGFRRLLAEQGGDLEVFYRAVERLAGLPPEEREAALAARPGGAG